MSSIVFTSAEEEEEFNALLQRLSSGIADLMLRMMQTAPRTWEEAKAYRDEIVELNRIAQTDEEQGSLLFAFNALMAQVAERRLVDDASLEKLKGVREADYRAMVIVQALIGDQIDPDRLEYVTRREVEAGRLAPDNDFRNFAIAGANVLGKPADAPKGRNWLGRLFGKN
jgi:HD superfamily phosphohydrolase